MISFEVLFTVLGFVVTVVSVSFSVYFGLRSRRSAEDENIAERIARETKIDMKLDEISRNVKEVRETVKSIQNDVKDHEGRIVKLEASYKAEHKRLDELFSIYDQKD